MVKVLNIGTIKNKKAALFRSCFLDYIKVYKFNQLILLLPTCIAGHCLFYFI